MKHLIVKQIGGLDYTADEGEPYRTNTRNEQIRIHCGIVLITLITLAITPIATAQIYKCDGPDGPVYSDKECGPDATHVELSTTPEVSGEAGVYDEAKVELAKKKADREQARNSKQALNSNTKQTDFSNLNSAGTTEPAGRWVRNPQRLRDRNVSREPKPVNPKPVTLPTGVKRRN